MATSKKKTPSKKSETREAAPYTAVFEQALVGLTAAIGMMDRKEYEAATEAFEGLAKSHPDELVFGGRCRTFAEICRRKMQPEAPAPQTADERYLAAVLMSNNGDTVKAIEMLDMALQDQPSSAKFLYARASAWALQGNAEAAVNDLRQAIAGEPHLRFQAVNDSDFEGIREEPSFIDIIEPTPAGA